MKLPVWPEKDQKNVPAPSADYNLDWEIDDTSSDDETVDVDSDDM